MVVQLAQSSGNWDIAEDGTVSGELSAEVHHPDGARFDVTVCFDDGVVSLIWHAGWGCVERDLPLTKEHAEAWICDPDALGGRLEELAVVFQNYAHAALSE
jgi:hypothetical protein